MAGPTIPFYGVCFTVQAFDPPPISASTTVDVNMNLPGALKSDFILNIIKPTLTAGLDLGNSRMTADGICSITFQNSTSSTINPPLENYLIAIARPENILGGTDSLSGGSVIFK